MLDKGLRGHVSQIIPGEWAPMSGLGVLWAEMKVSPTVAQWGVLGAISGERICYPFTLASCAVLNPAVAPSSTHSPPPCGVSRVRECCGGGVTK